MNPVQFQRTIMLIGPEGYKVLSESRVMVFGLGGVGSYAVEALARAGLGSLILIDYDRISITNLNRQLPALYSTVGRLKTEVVKERILEINPAAKVKIFSEMVTTENCERFIEEKPDYIVDAIDSIQAKVRLLYLAKKNNIPVISSMGAGNKLDPTKFKIEDISKTHTCPVAKIVRKELRALGITEGIKTVYSSEKPLTPYSVEKLGLDFEQDGEKDYQGKRKVPASISFVPAVAGLLLASVVVNDLLKSNGVDL